MVSRQSGHVLPATYDSIDISHDSVNACLSISNNFGMACTRHGLACASVICIKVVIARGIVSIQATVTRLSYTTSVHCVKMVTCV